MQLLDKLDAERHYLRSYDPDADDGHGEIVWTTSLLLAQRFPTVFEAGEEWRRPSTVHPIRLSDGKPNRPLSAFTVMFIRVAE
jgi:hypothetical protein